METTIARLEDKIDKLDSRLDEYNTQLTIHIEGVKQLREQNLLIRQEISMTKDQIKPIQKHITYVEGVLKFIGLLGIVASILSGFKLL